MKKELTVAEIATMFNVTTMGVRYWIANGLEYRIQKVIGIKPRMVIDPEDVYTFLGLDRKE